MLRSLGLITLLVSATLPALATSERGNEDLRRHCAGDATTFCGGVDPDGKEMDACSKAHRKELSENCRRAIDAYQAKGGK